MKMSDFHCGAILVGIDLRKTRGGSLPRPSGSRAAGFTVVEMLVVVVIIAALMTLILPALRGSRETSQLAVCASNQRNLGQATVNYMSDSFFQYPTYDTLTVAYEPSVLLCPVDYDPLTFPAGSVSNAKNLTISFGLNIEYTSTPGQIVTATNTPRPASKSLFFDGGRSTSDIQITNGPGYSNNPNGSANKGRNGKVNIIHKPGTPAQNDMNVAVASLGGHMGHGDMLGSLPPSGPTNAANLAKYDFNPRHQPSGYAGNILFADWHVAAYKQMDDSMFLYP